MTAYFNRFILSLTLKEAKDMYHQGRCDDDVEFYVEQPKFRRQLAKIASEDISDELKEYGFEFEEDSIEEQNRLNRMRILWLAAAQILEEYAEKRIKTWLL
jgi:folate-binding Fe-S cluster repair protein YgfZ